MPALPQITITPPRIEMDASVFDRTATKTGDAIEQQFLRDLWRAAIGNGDADLSAGTGAAAQSGWRPGVSATLLAAQLYADNTGMPAAALYQKSYSGPLALGPNAMYGEAIEAAGKRTGLQPSLLAAIISAEADTRDGVWDPASRNPRSTAAGLMQFLASTWETEAERPGTWLNGVAASNGWLDGRGRILDGARETLLNLRMDPQASIQAGADFARGNLASLASEGLLPADATAEDLAQLAYLCHQLGLGDAVRFLRDGGLPEGRARTVLASQIGSDAAAQRIASAGSGVEAHRSWLVNYIENKIDPRRFVRS